MAVTHSHEGPIPNELNVDWRVLSEPRVVIAGDRHVPLEFGKAAGAALLAFWN